MEDNRNLLKEKFAEGKALGFAVNESRNMVKELTNKIEQIRKENAMRGLVDDKGEIIKTPEEEQLQMQTNALKAKYSEQYSSLKELKAEIERIQALLERCKTQMNKDFENWRNVMLKQQSQ